MWVAWGGVDRRSPLPRRSATLPLRGAWRGGLGLRRGPVGVRIRRGPVGVVHAEERRPPPRVGGLRVVRLVGTASVELATPQSPRPAASIAATLPRSLPVLVSGHMHAPVCDRIGRLSPASLPGWVAHRVAAPADHPAPRPPRIRSLPPRPRSLRPAPARRARRTRGTRQSGPLGGPDRGGPATRAWPRIHLARPEASGLVIRRGRGRIGAEAPRVPLCLP